STPTRSAANDDERATGCFVRSRSILNGVTSHNPAASCESSTRAPSRERNIVTHEVVHLAIPDHLAKFLLTVRSLCRETEKAKQWLAANSRRLFAALTPSPKVDIHRLQNHWNWRGWCCGQLKSRRAES